VESCVGHGPCGRGGRDCALAQADGVSTEKQATCAHVGWPASSSYPISSMRSKDD